MSTASPPTVIGSNATFEGWRGWRKEIDVSILALVARTHLSNLLNRGGWPPARAAQNRDQPSVGRLARRPRGGRVASIGVTTGGSPMERKARNRSPRGEVSASLRLCGLSSAVSRASADAGPNVMNKVANTPRDRGTGNAGD